MMLIISYEIGTWLSAKEILLMFYFNFCFANINNINRAILFTLIFFLNLFDLSSRRTENSRVIFRKSQRNLLSKLILLCRVVRRRGVTRTRKRNVERNNPHSFLSRLEWKSSIDPHSLRQTLPTPFLFLPLTTGI